MSGRGLPYFEEQEYHKFLLSEERLGIFKPEDYLRQIEWKGIKNLLDFGMGNGFFLPFFYPFLDVECSIWGAECQELLIDYTLQLKVKENLRNFIPFYVDRTEHPLLPDWLPEFDLIFCSCTLSTFADPSLAIKGIGRGLKENGKIIVLDWAKMDSPGGIPNISQKVSFDRMEYFIEEAEFKITKKLKTSPYLYSVIIEK